MPGTHGKEGTTMHLTIDGFRGNPERLASEELVRELLDRIPDAIGMTKISTPHVQRYVGEKPEDWGVSGFVLIAESHITLHTFPERNLVWADIFSCKGFDADLATELLREAFELKSIQAAKGRRGLEYPHDVDDALPLFEDERVEVVGRVAELAVAGT
jgi:S-adenosylmethionine decarboxylase